MQCKEHGQPAETKTVLRKVGGKPGEYRITEAKGEVSKIFVYETTSDATKSFNKTRLEKYPLFQAINRSLKS